MPQLWNFLMIQDLIDKANSRADYRQKVTSVSQSIVGELLVVVANKGITELSHQNMRIISDGADSYRVECNAEVSVVEAFQLKTPFEVVMIVLGSKWDVHLDDAFKLILGRHCVVTPDELWNIRDETHRYLAVFRHAVKTIIENEPIDPESPTKVQPPAPAPLEGELVDEVEEEKPAKHWEGIRQAKAATVEYTKIEPLLKGGAVTQIVLYPSDTDEKPVVFPDRTAVANGQVLKQDLTQVTYDRLMFVMADGTTAMFQHHQDCCESVYIEDIEGDFMDLIGRPLLIAEEASHTPDCDGKELPTDYYGREIWSFYRFGGERGMVVVRWMGSSNGYYGEDVSCDITKGGNRENALGHDDETPTSP